MKRVMIFLIILYINLIYIYDSLTVSRIDEYKIRTVEECVNTGHLGTIQLKTKNYLET